MGRRVVVTNTTFRVAPWADALYGHDKQWWREYGAEVARDFRGDRVSCGTHYGAQRAPFQPFENSGTGALMLAAHRRAARIVMVGYDCQKSGGRVHHHGDHPPTLGNAGSMPKWPGLFAKAAARLAQLRVHVVNVSRETALTCFPRSKLEIELAETPP